MADNNCPDPDVYRRLSSMEAWSAEHRGMR